MPVALSQVAVQLRPEDNIAVAARNLERGLCIEFDGSELTVSKRVGLGHKLAREAQPERGGWRQPDRTRLGGAPRQVSLALQDLQVVMDGRG